MTKIIFLVMLILLATVIPVIDAYPLNFYRLDNINSTGLPLMTNVPYLVNGSGGFWLNNSQQLVWGLAQTINVTNRLYYNGATDYELINSSLDTLQFEVEVGNRSSVNATQLYSNDEMVHLRCATNTTGTTKMCYDSTKYSRNFTIRNGIWDNGIVGGGARAMGVAATDGLNLSMDTSWMDMRNLTMLVWVYPITTDRSGPMGIGNIVQEDIIQIEYNGVLKFLIDNSGSFTRCTSTTSYQANNWQMIGVSFNTDAKNMSIFYNGSLVKSCLGSPNTPMGYAAGDGGAYVGASSDLTNYPFNGRVDEAVIFNRTLTVDEVNMIYQNTKVSVLGDAIAGPPILPTITILSPTTTAKYNTTQVNLNVTADQAINNWFVSIDGGSNTAFTPNTTIHVGNGLHNITVRANNTGVVSNKTLENWTVSFPNIIIYQYANMSNIDNHSIVWKLNVVVFNNDSATITNIVVDVADNFSASNYTIANLLAGTSNLTQLSYNYTRQNITTGGIDVIINLVAPIMISNATGTGNTLTIVNPVDPPSKLSRETALYFLLLSDVMSGSDTKYNKFAGTRLSADISVFSDPYSKTFSGFRSNFDVITIVDIDGRQYVGTKVLLDTFLFYDLTGRVFSGSRLADVDMFLLTDLVSREHAFVVSLSDNYILIDSNDRIYRGVKTSDDTVTFTDSNERIFTGKRTGVDTFTLIDNSERMFMGNRVYSDIYQLVDLDRRTFLAIRSTTDTVTTSDSSNMFATIRRMISESIIIKDLSLRTAQLTRFGSDIAEEITSFLGQIITLIGGGNVTTVIPPTGGTFLTSPTTGMTYNLFCEPEVCIGCSLKCNVFISNPYPYLQNSSIRYYINGSQRIFIQTIITPSRNSSFYTVYVPIDSTTMPSVMYLSYDTGTPMYSVLFEFDSNTQISQSFILVESLKYYLGWVEQYWYVIIIAVSIIIVSITYKKIKKKRKKVRVTHEWQNVRESEE